MIHGKFNQYYIIVSVFEDKITFQCSHVMLNMFLKTHCFVSYSHSFLFCSFDDASESDTGFRDEAVVC